MTHGWVPRGGFHAGQENTGQEDTIARDCLLVSQVNDATHVSPATKAATIDSRNRNALFSYSQTHVACFSHSHQRRVSIHFTHTRSRFSLTISNEKELDSERGREKTVTCRRRAQAAAGGLLHARTERREAGERDGRKRRSRVTHTRRHRHRQSHTRGAKTATIERHGDRQECAK